MNYKNLIKKSSFLYCLLRNIKVFYIGLYSDESWINRTWNKKYSKPLNLNTPVTYNEKLQWLKIYGPRDKLASKCVDKLEVRTYVENKIGKKYLNDLIGIYNNVKEIDFIKLPSEFVLKATHDSGSVLIKQNGKSLDMKQLKQVECSLSLNYGKVSKEWVYNDIKPRIIVEKFLKSNDGKSLKDYKVFCFNGEPKLIQVDLERFEGHKRNFYDINWGKLDLEIEYPNSNVNTQEPDLLSEMLHLSKILSLPFIHTRIDWYISGNKLIFGEITFFHGGGFEKFNSQEWENRMGDWIYLK